VRLELNQLGHHAWRRESREEDLPSVDVYRSVFAGVIDLENARSVFTGFTDTRNGFHED
jgi:hypothetical protein